LSQLNQLIAEYAGEFWTVLNKRY